MTVISWAQVEKAIRKACQDLTELVDFAALFFINEVFWHIAKPFESWLFHFLVSAVLYELLVDSRYLIALFDK